MIDREKVIKGFECCIRFDSCAECPYKTRDEYCFSGVKHMMEDALELLKADQAELIRQHERIESLESFALWLARSVLSDDWDTDHDFYSEVICRKLVDLGYIKIVKDRYVGAEWSAEGD